MKQKITQMRLMRYLFTTVLALLFISCSKGCSYNESQSSHVEQTTASNQVEDKISPDDYELSIDGLTLIKWKNPNTKVLDMSRDTHLSKIRFIGDWAFGDCNSLKNINISNSVTSIGEWAFSYCINLGSVVFKGNNPPKIPSFDSYVFNETPSNLKLIIPKGAKNRYIKAGYPEDKIIEQ